MIKISEEEASFKGQLVRELIARVTSDHLIGQKFKNGEMRKKIVEPPWRCPAGFEMEEIHLPLFSMEYLTKTEGRREDRVLLQLHGGGYVGKSTIPIGASPYYMRRQEREWTYSL